MTLQRIQTGDYTLEFANDIDNICEEAIVPIKDLFSEKIVLKKEQESKLLNGIKIEEDKEEGIYNLYVGKKYLGLGKIEKGFLKRFIIL